MMELYVALAKKIVQMFKKSMKTYEYLLIGTISFVEQSQTKIVQTIIFLSEPFVPCILNLNKFYLVICITACFMLVQSSDTIRHKVANDTE